MSPPPWEAAYAGRLEHRVLEAKALTDNPLGDPTERPITIYLPPDYDLGAHFPAVYLLQGFGGMVTSWEARTNGFTVSVPERIDEVFAGGAIPGAIVVYVDAWTAVGGSQFVDSPATGNYHTYLCQDVVGFVDANYRTIADRDHRALQGHSSGGFGAVVNAMFRPDLFGAFACHAPDASFELWIPSEVGRAYRALRDRYGRSYDAFRADLASRTAMSRPDDHTLVIMWAMAACYSANADGTVELPFDLDTGALRHEIWSRWLEWDPVVMVEQRTEAIASMRAIWVDAGRSDEYFFDIGAERLAAACTAAGARDVSLELHEGTHRSAHERYPLAIAYLARAMGD